MRYLYYISRLSALSAIWHARLSYGQKNKNKKKLAYARKQKLQCDVCKWVRVLVSSTSINGLINRALLRPQQLID